MKFFLYGILGALMLFSAYICFFKLGTLYFADWDEAWYAEMTKELLLTKQFIVPQWNHSLYFDKPPLYIWSSAFFSVLFGLSEFSIRLPSAISGFITLLLVVWYSNKKWGIVPAIIAFSTLALNNVFIWRVRSGNLDALATLLIFLSFLVILSKHTYRSIVLGILFGLIYLTKASLVVLPIGIFVLYELIYMRSDLKKNLFSYMKTLIFFILLSGGWLLLGYFQAGKPFLTYYLFHSDQNVAKMSLSNFKLDYWSYAYYALQRRFFYLFVIGIAALIWKIKKREHFLIVVFSLALLLQLSFTARNNNWYLLPSMPFWSLAIAYAVYYISTLIGKYKFIFYILLLTLSAYISFKTFTVNIKPILTTETNGSRVETAKKIKTLSKSTDTLVRLDNLYPSAIYYSDRKVLASPSDAGTGNYFISRNDVVKKIVSHQLRWIFGTTSDVEKFIIEHKIQGKVIKVNDQEEILHIN